MVKAKIASTAAGESLALRQALHEQQIEFHGAIPAWTTGRLQPSLPTFHRTCHATGAAYAAALIALRTHLDAPARRAIHDGEFPLE